MEIPIVGKFAPKNRNFYFKLKFGAESKLNMQRSVGILICLFKSKETVFGQIWSQKIKLLFEAEISYSDWFEYAEFKKDAHFFCFRPETPFSGKFGWAIHNCYFKLKFDISINLNMQNSIVMLTFSALFQKYPFWANFVQKVKIVISTWNSVFRPIWIYTIQ